MVWVGPTALGPSRQVLVTPKLRAWVKCRFSSAAMSGFYSFKIRTSADPHFTPGQLVTLRRVPIFMWWQCYVRCGQRGLPAPVTTHNTLDWIELVENDLRSNKQYGFGHWTVLQLLQMTDKWTEYLESGGQIDTIYSDFEKAFDKMPHRRLISKLHTYGLHDTVINWICDFVAARKCRVWSESCTRQAHHVSADAVYDSRYIRYG